MATLSKRQFLDSEAAKLLRQELQDMVEDSRYNTAPRYSLAAPEKAHFVAKHLEYMSNHLQMDHKQYISNLKLMTKITH